MPPLVLEGPIRQNMPCLSRLNLTLIASVFVFLCFPHEALPSETYQLLTKIISEYNLKLLQQNSQKGHFVGQVGILKVTPEVGKALGLRVYMDEDYYAGKELQKRAEKLYEKIINLLKMDMPYMKMRNAANIARLASQYNRAVKKSRKRFQRYLANLSQHDDQRFDNKLCFPILMKLLKKSLADNGYRLRDSLAALHNTLSGIDDSPDSPLSPDNVEFVNHVVNRFLKEIPRKDLKGFYLDRPHNPKELNTRAKGLWRLALGNKEAPFEKYLKKVIENEDYHIDRIMDPVLFIALIRKESNFNPRAVSYVGAVGLTQIMPSTGKQLGMESIFAPSYFFEARKLLNEERRLRSRAISYINSINSPDMVQTALKAMDAMKASMSLGKKRAELFRRYKRELLRSKKDDRLDPEKAIRFGYRYLKRMLKKYNGDMSLALAAYNAGPNRIKDYKGIPPFSETVDFRNGVLRYYREYWSIIDTKIKTAKAGKN